MTRIAIVLGLAVAIWTLVFACVRFDGDARSLGLEDATGSALDTIAGRRLSLINSDPGPARQLETARALGDWLARHPLIEDISTGPAPPAPEVLDWLWQHRFRLMPPDTDAFEPGALEGEFRAAQRSLVSARGLAMGDRLLRDPTGSFRRLVERLSSTNKMSSSGGIWQTATGDASVVFATMKDTPFALEAMRDLISATRAEFNRHGSGEGKLIILGPRVITAEISDRIGRASKAAGMVTAVLLLAWLIWVGRSLAVILRIILPVTVGFGGAILGVHGLFGSVHLISLGFGGALIGLALDYPLHLLGHSQTDAPHTKRLVLLGATTTSVAFLALVFSGLPGLAQVGVFVAIGLICASAVSIWTCTIPARRGLRAPAAERFLAALPYRRTVLIVLGLVGGFGLAQGPVLRTDASQIVQVPAETLENLKSFQAAINAPDARYSIGIAASTADAVLDAAEAVSPLLNDLVSQDAISGFIGISDLLPSANRQRARLPQPDEFQRLLKTALSSAGLSQAFAPSVLDAYREALSAPTVTVETMRAIRAFSPITALISDHNGTWQSQVLLANISAPQAVADAVAELNHPAVSFVDMKASLSGALDRYRRAAIGLLLAGSAAALGILCLFTSRRQQVVDLSLTLAATLTLTTAISALITDGLGIFQIVALTLVMGIGIDYGLFLTMAGTAKRRTDAARSVSLCAITTLIAFTILAISPIQILSEIGLTVTVGIVLLLCFNFAFQPNSDRTGQAAERNREQP